MKIFKRTSGSIISEIRWPTISKDMV